MDRQKIFNVGLHKTGTTSIHTALEILGFRSEHGIPINKPKQKATQISLPLDNQKVMEVVIPRVMQADAFSDFPYPMLYRELDERFPGSKFILTTRERGAWIKSVQRHFQHRQPNGLFEWIYGVPRWSATTKGFWKSTTRTMRRFAPISKIDRMTFWRFRSKVSQTSNRFANS